MRRFICMTSVLALSAAFLMPMRSSAEEVPSLDGTFASSRLTPHSGTIDPFSGTIDPFSGSIDPFSGAIDPFSGALDPFFGTLDPFYGTLDPFSGTIDAFFGTIDPFFGTIDPFFGTIDPFWGEVSPLIGGINSSWGSLGTFSSKTLSEYADVTLMMSDLAEKSEAFWGEAIQKRTGQSFSEAFSDDVFARYGIDLDDPQSLENLTATDRALFFLDWYDGLMNFSGVDRTDHWMSQTNWSPRLTQDQGMGERSLIGLLDMSINNNVSFENNIEFVGGYEEGDEGHGAGVVSLIVSPHDGEGIMGIAPSATVLNYNPFDETNTASWKDVESGVNKLAKEGSSVINISLGVPGWTLHSEWAGIFERASARSFKYDPVLVKAAGNEGAVQTQDLKVSDDDVFENLIIVGSVDPRGTISTFSNTPGEACVVEKEKCEEANKLKYRFMVAPGELILVSDGAGGITRVSGTSFAAPLVSGAITLLHDRWPWFKDYAEETIDIMFESARDLGASGVDSVYGHGLLDVEASQSPLSFDALIFYYPDRDGYGDKLRAFSASTFKKTVLKPGKLDIWEVDGISVFALEEIGDTHRDFAIPLSTLLHGQKGKLKDNYGYFQRHLYQRLLDWATGSGFSDIGLVETPMSAGDGWSYGFTASPIRTFAAERRDQEDLAFRSGLVIKNSQSGLEFRLGAGDGAVALSGQSGFGFYSDYDLETGGVNPLLGFASGGAYASAAFDLLKDTRLAIGLTQSADDPYNSIDDGTLINPEYARNILPEYEASAFSVDVAHALSDTLSLNTSYTQLIEETGLLGAQGSGVLGLSGGTVTDSYTLGADLKPLENWQLAASITIGDTRATEYVGSSLSISDSGLRSSAFALTAMRTQVFSDQDAMRFSFMQPLHVEGGTLTHRSVQVIDRLTGELGVVSEEWTLGGGDRKFVAETLYMTSVLGGAVDVKVFGQLKFSTDAVERSEDEFLVGSQLNFKF